MASSSALRYPNSSSSSSVKPRQSSSAPDLARQIRNSTIPRHLHDVACAGLKFDKFGKEIWASVESLAVETCGRSQKGYPGHLCRRTVQSHLRQLVKLEVWEEAIPAGSPVRYNGERMFRRTATYRVNFEKITPRETREQYQAKQVVVMPRPSRSARSSSFDLPPAQKAEPQIQPGASTAPAVAPPVSKPGPALTTRQRAELGRRIPWFQHGRTYIRPPEGGMPRQLARDDPHYIAPMSRQEAILAACKSMCEGFEKDGEVELRSWGTSMERAIEAAESMGYKVEPEGSA